MCSRIISLAACALLVSFTVQGQIVVKGAARATAARASETQTRERVTKEDFTPVDNAGYECVFQWDVVATDKDGRKVPEVYACMLQFGQNGARFTDYRTFQADSAVFAGEDGVGRRALSSARGNAQYKFTGDVIQGYPSGKITYTDIVTPDYLEYTEPLGNIEWQLEEATDTVCGYLCGTATADYGGRRWTAWYAEEIPSAYGPWKFNGLPGLILKVCDSEGVHTMQAISIKRGEVPIVKPHNKMIVTTDRKNFVDSKNRFEKKPFDYISPESITSMDVHSGGQVFINGVPVPKRPNGYTPVELK